MQAGKNQLLETELELVLSVLRHQLGNSVNALKITLDVLRESFDTFDETKKKEYLQRMARLVNRQQETVQALKSYSMFAAREQKSMAFSAFWTQLLALISQRLETRQVKLLTRYETMPCTVMINQAALNKVILGVIENALEALANHSAPEIEIRTGGGTSRVDIVVRDNGTGSTVTEMDTLFTPLFTTKPGKSGMGLAIARKLMTEMGGGICMQNSPPAGVEVSIWLNTFAPDSPAEPGT